MIKSRLVRGTLLAVSVALAAAAVPAAGVATEAGGKGFSTNAILRR